MLIHKIHDLRTNANVTELLIAGLSENKHDDKTKRNYNPLYRDDPANLLYVLDEGRYETGAYFVLEQDGKYCGSAGWNKYNSTTALCLTRAYIPVHLRSRFLLAKYILPRIIEETVDFEKLWMTVNEYNKGIYDWIERMPRTTKNWWPDVYSKFAPLGVTQIYNTKQFVMEYER